MADPISYFIEAPAGVQALAQTITAGGDVTPEALAALPGGALEQGWGLPVPDAPQMRHTLLRHAVVERHVDAARALMAAGADARFNGDEMAFIAVQTKADGPRLWWPDYGPGNAMLELWLGAEGDPNVINLNSYGLGPILLAVPGDNLVGVLTLLRAGADPWYRMPAPDDTSPDPYRYSSFFLRLATANPMSLEMSFRIAREGFYRGGSEEDHRMLLEAYENLMPDYTPSRGPSDMATMWQMQMTLSEVVPALGLTVLSETSKMMAIEDTAKHGGFWLAEGEFQSPNEDAQVVSSDNPKGTELWHGRG